MDTGRDVKMTPLAETTPGKATKTGDTGTLRLLAPLAQDLAEADVVGAPPRALSSSRGRTAARGRGGTGTGSSRPTGVISSRHAYLAR